MASIGELLSSLKVKITDLGLKEKIEDFGGLSVIAITVVIFMLIILIIIERRLHKRMIIKSDRNAYYLGEINKAVSGDFKNFLGKIDEVSISFFKERFGIVHATEYSELENFFRKMGNKEAAEFCKIMNSILYSKKKTDVEINQKLVIKLSDLIKNNSIKIDEKSDKGILQKLRDIELKIKQKIFG